MYLKEIKTSGFKSFADKINLSLDENITCIVGPNGSGKSNIVDAVKWVLGEQSVKTLRGDGNLNTEHCRRENIHGIAEGFYRKGRNKLDSTSSRKWKVYSMIWTRLFPIRRYLLFAYRKLWRL